jgi:hypothetical protein
MPYNTQKGNQNTGSLRSPPMSEAATKEIRDLAKHLMTEPTDLNCGVPSREEIIKDSHSMNMDIINI